MTATARRGRKPQLWSCSPRGGLDRLGNERAGVAVTLPRLTVLDLTHEYDAEECADAARRVAEQRVVRNGIDAWNTMHVADDLDRWCLVGAALNVGRQWALKITGANRPAGGMYSRAMGRWCAENQFGQMPKTTRSYALALFEHAGEIEKWRKALPGKQQRLGGLRLLRRWRRQTQAAKPRYDDIERARAAWRRFVTCVQALPADQAAPLWQVVSVEVNAAFNDGNGADRCVPA